MSEPQESAEQYCRRIIDGFRDKADHNKRETLLSFYVVLGASAIAPLFIAFGQTHFWGKIVPAVLSVLAGLSAGWLQLRRPQQLWGLYRESQRYLEHELACFRHGIEGYADASTAARTLASHTASIALSAHQSWMTLIPTPKALDALEVGGVKPLVGLGARNK